MREAHRSESLFLGTTSGKSVATKTGVGPLIDRVFPFDQLPAAFKRLAEGPMAKVIIEAIDCRQHE